jgi:hypothetical protein
MSKFVVIEAPSILGLKPTGVECLPDALKGANLLEELGAEELKRRHIIQNETKQRSCLIHRQSAVIH